MIYVKRIKPPSSLVGFNSQGEKERKAWKDYYQMGEHTNPDAEKPEFRAYRLESVKNALTKMFHGKCLNNIVM